MSQASRPSFPAAFLSGTRNILTEEQSHAIHETLLARNPAYTWLVDRKDRILYLNERFRIYVQKRWSINLKQGDSFQALPFSDKTKLEWKNLYAAAFSGANLHVHMKLETETGDIYTTCRLIPLQNRQDGQYWGVLVFALDDSVDKRFKEKFHKYKLLYHQAERLLGIGSAVWDIQKGEIVAYGNFSHIYGLQKESFRFSDWMQKVHPEDAEKVGFAWQEALAGKKPYNLEHRIVRGNDGQIRVVRAVAEVLRGTDGKPVKVYGVVQDVTDFCSIEDNYKQNLEKYKQLFGLISDAIFLIDNESGNILEANNAATILYGYSREELLTLKNTALSAEPGKTRQATKERLNAVPIRYHRKKDGAVFPVEITASHYEYQGRPVHIAAIRDITERRKTEAEMERIGKLLNETQRISKIGGWEIDVASGVAMWTDEVYHICGLDPQTHTPLNLDQVIDSCSPQARKSLQDAHQRALVSGEPYDLELPFKRADGQTICVRIIGNAVMEVGAENVSRFRGTIMDITETKNAEALYTSILESIPMAVLGLHDRRILFANRDVEKVFGWKPEELIGKPTRILYRNEKDYRAIGEAVYGHLCRHHTYTSDTSFFCRHKDGHDIVCRLKAAIVGDQPGNTKIVVTYEDVTDLVNTKERLGQTHEELKRALYGAIKAISTMVEAKDPYTAGHQERVRQLAVAIAQELSLSDAAINHIEIASILHDVGKIQIPADLLVKPSKLTDLEFSLIKEHAEVGYRIVKDIALPGNVAEAVYQHHEALDGSGYPRGLHGDQIIMEARIIAVADVVEAMSSHRPYRPALGIDIALEEIQKHQGLRYDPHAVAACRTLFAEKGFSWAEEKRETSVHFLSGEQN